MKYSYQSALLVSLFVLGLGPSAQAQVQSGTIPEFVPSSPWVIGETGLAEVRGVQGVKLPCMMVNQFDNGFIVRFAGGGNKLSAMAIDFRQPIFRKGGRYGASVYTDAGFTGAVQGTAFNESTLIFNLRDAGDMYGALKSGKLLGVSIGNNDMRFSLSNMGQGLERLESCFGGAPAPSAQSAAAQIQNPGAAPAVEPATDFAQTPTSLAEIQAAAPAAEGRSAGHEVYIKRGQKMPQNVTSNRMGASPAQMGNGPWTAKAGDNLQSVMSGWADKAGVDLQWQASGGGQVAQDFTHNGTFQEAVTALLSENAAASGLQSHYDNGTSPRARSASYVAADPVPLSPASVPNVAPTLPSAPRSDVSANGRWMAPRGGSLQSVLQQWGAQQGVEVLWYANSGYTIKDNINQGGSFESALQTLLQTYENDNNRPVGRLNTDPGTGRKVLVIETDRAL